MHTFLARGDGFDVRFCNALGGGEVLYHTRDKMLAMEVASFLNGGKKPFNWGLDSDHSEPKSPGEKIIDATRELASRNLSR